MPKGDTDSEIHTSSQEEHNAQPNGLTDDFLNACLDAPATPGALDPTQPLDDLRLADGTLVRDLPPSRIGELTSMRPASVPPADHDRWETRLDQRDAELERRRQQLGRHQDRLARLEAELTRREAGLARREAERAEREEREVSLLRRIADLEAELTRLRDPAPGIGGGGHAELLARVEELEAELRSKSALVDLMSGGELPDTPDGEAESSQWAVAEARRRLEQEHGDQRQARLQRINEFSGLVAGVTIGAVIGAQTALLAAGSVAVIILATLLGAGAGFLATGPVRNAPRAPIVMAAGFAAAFVMAVIPGQPLLLRLGAGLALIAGTVAGITRLILDPELPGT